MKVMYRRAGYTALVFVSIGFASILLDQMNVGLPGNTLFRYLILSAFLGFGFGPLCLYFSYKTYRRKNLLSEIHQTTLEGLRPGFNAVRARLNSDPVIAPVSGRNAALAKVNVNYAGPLLSRDKIYCNDILLNSTNSFSIDLDEDSSITLPGFESEFDVFHGFGRSEEPVKSFEQRMNVWTGIKRFYIEKGIPKGDQVTLIGEFEKENNDIVLKSSKNIPVIIASKPLEQLLDYYGRKSRKYFLYGLVLLFAPSILSLIALLA